MESTKVTEKRKRRELLRWNPWWNLPWNTSKWWLIIIFYNFPQEQLAVLRSQWTQASLIELVDYGPWRLFTCSVNWDITCDTPRVECKHCLGSFLWLVGYCHDHMIRIY
jgi:hypothetical protein